MLEQLIIIIVPSFVIICECDVLVMSKSTEYACKPKSLQP